MKTSTAVLPGPVLVAVAHGSRDPRALRTVRALLQRIRARRPGLDVRLGHVELNEPLLTDTLAELRGEAVLVPLLLGRGHHVRYDLPAALAGAPHVRGVVAAPLGPHPLLTEALYERLVQAGRRDGDRAVVLAAAGSRDPDSAVDTARTAALLSARLGGVPVLPAYACAAAPTVTEAVAALVSRGLREVAVASYFTAPGRFASQTARAAPWIVSAPLGAHDAMARLVLRRYEEALGSAEAVGALGPAGSGYCLGRWAGPGRQLPGAGRDSCG
jgi:sirohydrochlorin ferrochelatase